MIAYIVLSMILLTYLWLLQETDYLLVRLPVGAVSVNKTTITLVEKKLDEYIKLYEAEKPETPQPIENPNIKPPAILLLTEQCQLTRLQAEFAGSKYRDRIQYSNTRRSEAYQLMKIENTTVILPASSPKLYDLIAKVSKVQTDNLRPLVVKSAQLPLTNFISTEREGDFYKHDYTYKTVFHDCLPGKEWLEAHYQDHKDFVPSMDIQVDGAVKFAITDGVYKKNSVQDFMKQYTRKVRIGRKSVVIPEPMVNSESELVEANNI